MFTAATYNVLATAHLGKGDYSRVPPELLDAKRRTTALVGHVAALNADLLFLQEVEDDVFEALKRGLAGYQGRLEKRTGKPDGCATFWRAGWSVCDSWRLEYRDGDAGHVALVVLLEDSAGRILGTANTHLKWDPPRTTAEKQIGYRQASQIAEVLEFKPPPAAWLVAGDFNRSPDGEVLKFLAGQGFASAHARAEVPTFATRGGPRQIDFLLHTAALIAEPRPSPALPPVMPCEGQPSDHLALAATFTWRGADDTRPG
jgi:mRNA deadenylase 3'-5' endonuclease subunit Ccr4